MSFGIGGKSFVNPPPGPKPLNREKNKSIVCSFWVGSTPTNERRPFPAHPALRDMLNVFKKLEIRVN
jgi:hypothetical protein